MMKLSAFFAVVAFAASSSVALACDSSGDKGSKDKSDDTTVGVYEGGGCDGGSCGGKKDKDNP
jgi:hypothetical protein